MGFVNLWWYLVAHVTMHARYSIESLYENTLPRVVMFFWLFIRMLSLRHSMSVASNMVNQNTLRRLVTLFTLSQFYWMFILLHETRDTLFLFDFSS